MSWIITKDNILPVKQVGNGDFNASKKVADLRYKFTLKDPSKSTLFEGRATTISEDPLGWAKQYGATEICWGNL